MKSLILGALVALTLGSAVAAQDHYVRGYARSDGTYVAPHYQTNPNNTTSDNYSTIGNTNPYTGQPGTKPDTRPGYGSTYTPTPTYTAPPYGSTYGTPNNGSSYGNTPNGSSSYGSQPACTSSYGC